MIGHICSQRSGGTDTAQAGKGGPGGTVLDSGGLRPSLSSSSSSPSSSASASPSPSPSPSPSSSVLVAQFWIQGVWVQEGAFLAHTVCSMNKMLRWCFFFQNKKNANLSTFFFLQLRIFHRSGFESRVQRPNQACKVCENVIKSDDTSLSLLLL